MQNLTIRQFRNNITNYINASDIPVEVKYLVAKDICNQLEAETNRQVYVEQQLTEKNQSKEAEHEQSV